jgi:hypothetical protein
MNSYSEEEASFPSTNRLKAIGPIRAGVGSKICSPLRSAPLRSAPLRKKAKHCVSKPPKAQKQVRPPKGGAPPAAPWRSTMVERCGPAGDPNSAHPASSSGLLDSFGSVRVLYAIIKDLLAVF